jgi:hippurate hydrolase
MMAAADRFQIRIEGRGGHAAKPHETIDPVVAAAQVISALQSIASRVADPLESVVISVTAVNAGTAYNVIPQAAELKGTVRTLTKAMREMAEKRLHEIGTGVSAAMGCHATIDYEHGYPVTFNHAGQTEFSAKVAAAIAGEGNVDLTVPPTMGSEDFSFMLDERPGSYIFMGNGDTAGVHHPAYDFNDKAIPFGVSYWVKIIETGMPA